MSEGGFRRPNMQALKDLLTGLNGLRENGRSWILPCPICGKDEKLYIRKTDGRTVCFCGDDRAAVDKQPEFALSPILGIPAKLLADQLYDVEAALPADVGLELDFSGWFTDDDELPEDLQPLPSVGMPLDFYSIEVPQAKPGLDYLLGRGLTLDVARKYKLMYCPPQRRVIFPVYRNDQLLGWQARTIDPTTWIDAGGNVHSVPKALTMAGLKTDQCLMFEDQARGGSHVILCEGPMDALKMDAAGGAVATMGKQVSMQQLNLVRMMRPSRVYIALDPDAFREMNRLAEQLSDMDLWVIQPLAGYKDLGELTSDQAMEAFRAAKRIDASMIFMYLSAT